MRRIATTALAIAAIAAVPATAQAQAAFGATAAWHEDADFGLGAFVEAPLTQLHENVGIMGEFVWFFPDEGESFGGADVDVTYFEINGNLTYDFMLEGNQNFTPFALGGLNIARTSVDVEGGGFGGDGSNTDVGLNVGGGLTFGSGTLRPQVGARVELGGGEGFVIFGSILLGG